jgi:hypothetical protein
MTDDAASDQNTLAADARFDSALQRVNFQPGILLGAEALNAEQSFYLRRLTRAQRWLTGPGTVFGLYVEVSTPVAPEDVTDVRLTVYPGYAIDGLGREIVVGVKYAMSLRDWVNKQGDALKQSYDHDRLSLRVTARAQSQEVGLQPVAADLFDSGLNPVVSARIEAGFLLELLGDKPSTAADAAAKPFDCWAPPIYSPDKGGPPAANTSREDAMLGGLSSDQKAFLTAQANLLRRGPPAFRDSPGSQETIIESARILLASLRLPYNPSEPTIFGSSDVQVNNLVRPFIRPDALLTALSLP